MQTEEQTIASVSIINRAAVKRHSLRVASATRPKFTRVSGEFIDRVQANFETALRAISPHSDEGLIPVEDGTKLYTGLAKSKVEEKLNELLARIIQREVKRHPSIGVTLK